MKLKIIILTALCVSLVSCAQVVPSYTVDGEGIEWGENPVQTLPASRVTPNVRVPLPEQLGGGSVVVPIVITPSK